uniref:CXXC motif containing zinc binding protein n=1 Tax=Myotis myotis TaxID=51298 RepID=A0A7J7RTC1_MYOMY|nr:hypothetical protein mMyoMyo1_010197 [Myotis myotis]
MGWKAGTAASPGLSQPLWGKSRCSSENVTNLRPVREDSRRYLELKCGHCGELSEKQQYIRLMDSVAQKGGRGSAPLVQKCKLCAREHSVEIPSSTIRSHSVEDNEKFSTIGAFECGALSQLISSLGLGLLLSRRMEDSLQGR